MKNKEKLLNRILKNQEVLVGVKWAESRKKALDSIKEMKIRQESLTQEQARQEAFEQAAKIRKLRFEENHRSNSQYS